MVCIGFAEPNKRQIAFAPSTDMNNHCANSSGPVLFWIAIGQTVAVEFATIAVANNYWKDK